MSQTLEERVERLEHRVADLSLAAVPSKRQKAWRGTFGAFQNDADFEEAVRFGREYRKQQTYEKEVADSTLPHIPKEKGEVVYQALGWLAREDKIDFRSKEGKTFVSLNDEERERFKKSP